MSNLTPEDIEYFEGFLEAIEALGESIEEPMDPKIEPLLEVIHGMVVEQLKLDKHYKWLPAAEEDDRLLNDSSEDIPSAEDLRKMMEGD